MQTQIFLIVTIHKLLLDVKRKYRFNDIAYSMKLLSTCVPFCPFCQLKAEHHAEIKKPCWKSSECNWWCGLYIWNFCALWESVPQNVVHCIFIFYILILMDDKMTIAGRITARTQRHTATQTPKTKAYKRANWRNVYHIIFYALASYYNYVWPKFINWGYCMSILGLLIRYWWHKWDMTESVGWKATWKIE